MLTFSTVGLGGSSWQLSDDQIARWQEAYPNLDVEGQCKKARVWLEANPMKRKTARGMLRFLVNWLNRAVDRGDVRREPPALKPDIRGHFPPCKTNTECLRKVLAS